MALGAFNCTTGMAPYKGQDKPVACPFAPPSIAKFPMNPYDAYHTRSKVNQDWYIQGQIWTHS